MTNIKKKEPDSVNPIQVASIIVIVLCLLALVYIYRGKGPQFEDSRRPKLTALETQVEALQPKEESQAIVEPPKEEVKPEVVQTPPPAPTPVVEAPKPVPVPTTPSDNEAIAWRFFISQGFTRNQTAGIMGNLYQEHKFLTSDVSGGLGIAQWLGARRARLMAKGDYLDINVQLNFIMEELNTTENVAMRAIKATDTVEGATIAFEKKFERCGKCKTSNRIQFAYSILNRY